MRNNLALRRSTQVELVGGLGNQLFGYVAGKYLEKIHGHDVCYNTWHVSRGLTNHGASLEGRGLSGQFVSRSPAPQWARKWRPPFKSANIGWDPRLDFARKGRRVEGYFQTWRYLRSMGNFSLSSRDLLLQRQTSDWLEEHLEMAKIEKPLIMHFRRGDYKKVSGVMGLLGPDYYRAAIAEVPERQSNSPIWILSDEPELAVEFFAGFSPRLRVMMPPQEADPAESIVLMAHGSGHIIGNSTFSWWGAMLSPTSKFVIAPNPWFANDPMPCDLLPGEWVTVKHQWRDEQDKFLELGG